MSFLTTNRSLEAVVKNYEKNQNSSSSFNNHSVYLDGINDYVDLSDAAPVISTSAVGTLSCWVYRTAAATTNDRILHFSDSTSGDYLDFYIDSLSKLRVDCRIGGVYQWRYISTNLGFGIKTWDHIGVIQNGTSVSMYHNGSLMGSSLTAGGDQTAWLNDFVSPIDIVRIGCYASMGGVNSLFYEGNVDEVSVHNIVKPIGEFWNGTGAPTNQSGSLGLKGYWRMEEGSGITTVDSSTYSNVGNLQGAVFSTESA